MSSFEIVSFVIWDLANFNNLLQRNVVSIDTKKIRPGFFLTHAVCVCVCMYVKGRGIKNNASIINLTLTHNFNWNRDVKIDETEK